MAKKSLTTEQAIERYVRKHGDTYDYSQTVYNGNGKHVNVICRTHGEFSIQHNNHVSGSGCGKCRPKDAGRPRIARATCDLHGEYLVHKGCSSCKFHSQRRESFIKKSVEAHGDLYDYSSTDYVNMTERVDILCKSCNTSFNIEPRNHCNKGVGCQRCHKGIGGFDKTQPAYLYLFKADNMFKVGITNRDVKTRCIEISGKTGIKFEVLRFVRFEDGVACIEAERNLLGIIREQEKVQTDHYFDGHKECFVSSSIPDYVNCYLDNAQNLTRSTT